MATARVGIFFKVPDGRAPSGRRVLASDGERVSRAEDLQRRLAQPLALRSDR